MLSSAAPPLTFEAAVVLPVSRRMHPGGGGDHQPTRAYRSIHRASSLLGILYLSSVSSLRPPLSFFAEPPEHSLEIPCSPHDTVLPSPMTAGADFGGTRQILHCCILELPSLSSRLPILFLSRFACHPILEQQGERDRERIGGGRWGNGGDKDRWKDFNIQASEGECTGAADMRDFSRETRNDKLLATTHMCCGSLTPRILKQ